MRIVKCNHCDGAPECAIICPTGAIAYSTTTSLAPADRHGKISRYLKEIDRVSATQEASGAD
jgi:Fe-S-cluster-containing hydrogenase component 2